MQKLLNLCVFLILFPALSLANEDELLPPEQAFKLSATIDYNQRINLNWAIAEGYYLYREKLSLVINNRRYDYNDINLPEGISVQDPLFGQVVIYKNALNFSFQAQSSTNPLKLIVNSQGCYEPLGVCYPPQTHEFELFASNQSAQPVSSSITDVFNQSSVFSARRELDFLPVDEAFQLVITATDPDRVMANFEAAQGYYLYKPHIKFSTIGDDIVINAVEYPPGLLKDDPHFGDIEVYYGNATIAIKLSRITKNNHLILTAQYQGCAEDGICYPPQTRDIELVLADFDGLFDVYSPSNSDQTIDKSLLWYLLAAFGGGLLLTFTPCVLPMIPILSGIIISEKGQGGLQHSGLLSVIYVMGTATSYTLIGAVAGSTGEQLQAYFQTPWAIGLLSALLVVMAVAMFGIIRLQVPAFIQTNLAGHTQKLASGGVLAIFLMGMVSALIVGACVSPLLISTLSIAIAKGSPVLGGALMFSMAMGMGVVLIFIGFEFGHLLPKAGAWMEHVNKVIGILLLAVAIYLLGFLPGVPVLLLWGMLLAGTGVYLLTKKFTSNLINLNIAAKTIAIFSLIWGILALVGGFNGYRDIMNPLPVKQLMAEFKNDTADISTVSLFTIVKTNDEIDALFIKAQTENKLLMLDYYADWCLDCLRMDGTTFKEPSVFAMLNKNFIIGKVDISDATNDEVKAVKKRFNVYGPPATLFFSASGQGLNDQNFYGYKDSEAFLQILNQMAVGS